MSERSGFLITVLVALAVLIVELISSPLSGRAEPGEVPNIMPVPRAPMGWNSWNSFSDTVDSQIVVRQAKALVASGMKAAGYQYVLIDEGWWLGHRDAQGNIIVDPKQWPAIEPREKAGDMSNIVQYIHSLGLKAGIYTDVGEYGCGFTGPDIGPPIPHTGSLGHYEQDFLQFTKWGFDYVKVDWCGGDKANLDPAVQYAEVARSIAKAEAQTGRGLYLSICNWGRQSPWTWAPGIGNVIADIWRTSGDIVEPIVAGGPHVDRRVSLKNILTNFDAGMHPFAEHTGYYNDLDMMVLGMPGSSEEDNRTHMSLWAISGAPLIVGADLTKLTAQEFSILNNADVIAVQHDALGLQCVKVSDDAGLQVWAKPLAETGRRAIVLLNRTDSAAPISVFWNQLGLAAGRAKVRDVWAHKDLGLYVSSYKVTVPAHNVAMFVVYGADAKPTEYKPTVHSHDTVFDRVAASGTSFVRVAYKNTGLESLVMELRVNGAVPTRVSFPPTKSGGSASIMIEAELKTDKSNVLTFSPPCGRSPAIDSIYVSSW